MTKLTLLVLFSIFMNAFVQETHAAWYGDHSVWHDAAGMTECDDDGDTTGGVGDTTYNKDHQVIGWDGTDSGNMTCQYWDGAAPTGSVAYSTTSWTAGNVTVNIACNDAGGSSCNMYAISGWTVSGLTYSQTFTANTSGSITLLDNAGNATPVAYSVANIDKTTPTTSDITYVCPVNELAINPKGFAVTASSNGGAPITEIDVDFERVNDPANYDLVTNSVSSNTLNFSRDISKVDGSDRDIVTPGGRQYWFRIVRLKDAAGNELAGSFAAPLKNCDFNVYSNTQNITTKQVGTHSLASGQTADGQSQSMPVHLADTYGNAVIPASWIGRTIDFHFNVNNSLYLNQYDRSGLSAVFAGIPSDPTFLNRMPISAGATTSFNAQPSNNGTYPFNFKVYTPTKNAYDKADGQFTINNITFNVNGSLGGVPNQSIASSAIDFNFKPLYQTAISEDLRDGGFIEGAQQNSSLSLTKNASPVAGSNPVVKVKFGGSDSSKFKLYGGTINTNHEISTLAAIQNSVLFPSSTNNLFTKLIQYPGAVGNISNTYLSTHIAYTLPDPNGSATPLSILYNSDIIGKGNYFDGIYLAATQQNGVKILGLTSTKDSQELVTNQFAKDVTILGNSDKFANKTQLIKNATLFARNISPDNGGNTITNLAGGNTAGGVEVSNVLYFGNLGGSNVTLGNVSDVSVSGKRTILVIGGNLYIKKNVYYSSLTNDMLGIIVLKDAAGRGGNIYIDPDVTNIAGSLFAEKSLISYNGTSELDGNTWIGFVKNQLHIYGDVFSENTIGGSRKSPAQCPFYVPAATCSTVEAQKYDLNYLRRYYLVGNVYPYGNAKVIGGGTCNLSSTCGPSDSNLLQTRTFTSTNDKYASFPVIIEYNANIQKNPPPLFNLKL